MSRGNWNAYECSGTDLAHGPQEGLHAPAGEPPCWRRLKQHCTKSDCSSIGYAECNDRFESCQDEVEEAMLPAAKQQLRGLTIG